MADYYPLLARAVQGLSDQTPEARRAVYERARAALVAQLRSLNPPLGEPEIEREIAALNNAVDRVEADYTAPAAAGLNLDAFSDILSGKPSAGAPRPAPPGHGLRAPAPPEDDDAQAEAHAEAVISRPKVESRPHLAIRKEGHARTIILGSVLAVVILGIAAIAWWQGRSDAPPPQQPTVAETPRSPAAPADSAKINDRVGGQVASASGNASRPAVSVAQRAVFYEEDPANPQAPKAQVGRVVWRLEDINPGQGQPLEKAVSAMIEIPDAGMTMRLVLRRNLDPTLPASHTVELTFTTRPGESGRVIRDVGLLQFKNEEAARGTPVAGLPVPVRENLFLIGLSNLQGDVERNTELFVRRNWIDLPVRMASGQRAILSFEKGASGEQIINSAFTQWQ